MMLRLLFLSLISFSMFSCEDMGSNFIEPNYIFSGVKSAEYDAAGQVTIYWDEVAVDGFPGSKIVINSVTS